MYISIPSFSYRILEEDTGVRFDVIMARVIKQNYPDAAVTRSTVHGWIKKGYFSSGSGVTLKPSTKVDVGELIEFVFPAVEVEESELLYKAYTEESVPILFEDDAIIVINKPKSLPVHPGIGTGNRTVANILLTHLNRALIEEQASHSITQPFRPGIVHRLDKDTTGVLVIAKTKRAHLSLSKQFADHSIVRKYYALVAAHPKRGKGPLDESDEGTIDLPIGRHRKNRTAMQVREDGKRAISHWRIIKRMQYAYKVEVSLETGRTHQVRVHLTHNSAPIIGDAVYTTQSMLPAKLQMMIERVAQNQCLHARELSLDHPETGERVLFKADPPEVFSHVESLIESYRGGSHYS